MEKKWLYLILFVLLLSFSQSVTAQEQTTITLYKQSYAPSETLQADISLNNPERALEANQITLRDATNQKIPIAPLLLRRTEHGYFFYVDLPSSLTAENYSLSIESVPYIVNGNLKKITTKKEFAVTFPSNKSFFTLRPGGFVIEQALNAFEITITNKGITTPVTITASEDITHVYTAPETLEKDKQRTLKFSQSAAKSGEITLRWDEESVHIPLFVKGVWEEESNKTAENKTTNSTPQSVLQFVTDLKTVKRTLDPEQVLSGPLDIKNIGNATTTGITIEVHGNVSTLIQVNATALPAMVPGQQSSVFFWANKQKNAQEGVYEGSIVFINNEQELTLPLVLTVKKRPAGENRTDSLPLINKTTKTPDRQGSDQQPQLPFLTNKTAPQQPIKEKKSSIGFVVLGVVLVILLILFLMLRRKKTTEQTTSFEDYVKQLKR